MLTNSEKIVLLQRDLARMTRRHRDALCKLRKTRMEVSKWKAMEAGATQALKNCQSDRHELLQKYLALPSCTRRCPIRKCT